MRIIIFTDSLGRPRPDINQDEATEYEDTYGYKVKKHFANNHDIELLYIESLDTIDAIHWSQRMVAFRRPDIVIFQIGINDCAPRIFKKKSNSIFLNKKFNKITFNLFMKFIGTYRFYLTKVLNRTYTSPQEFRRNFSIIISEIKKYNINARFITISIAKTSNSLSKRSYNINNNINTYNAILKDIFINSNYYVDVNDISSCETLTISDGIHLTKETHKKLAEILKKNINECVELQAL